MSDLRKIVGVHTAADDLTITTIHQTVFLSLHTILIL